ncbi:MAG TPA: sugar transferase [Aggregatilineales bacterium]|nr:sugar transferase [Anaerolineales bacterium]HRE48319.1 sugar transferase [Aggregatilineales bacterium]
MIVHEQPTTAPSNGKIDWARRYFRALPLIDFVLVLTAFGVAYLLRYTWQIIRPVDEALFSPFASFIPYALIFAILLVIVPPITGLYRMERGRTWTEEIYRLINGAGIATVLIMALSFLLQPRGFSRLLLIMAAGITVFLLALARLVYRLIRQAMRRRNIGLERVLLVGAGHVGRTVLSALLAKPDLSYIPVGYLDDNPERGQVDMGRLKGLGDLSNLEGLLKGREADLVIVALPWDARDKIIAVVRDCEAHNIVCRVVPDLFQLGMSHIHAESLEGIPLLGLRSAVRMNPTEYATKRALDLVLIALSLPFLLPIMGLISLSVWLDSRGAIFYSQKRIGKDGRPFQMIKFRTMIPGADKMHAELIRTTGADPKRPKLVNDPRRTRVGRWLRRTSLDELPNLINVLRGEMSIIGPRPPTPDEVELYEAWQRQRLNTLPGITGLWQVSGRSKIPFEEQCLLDIYYIENWSLGLDMQILLRTIPNVLLGNGAY